MTTELFEHLAGLDAMDPVNSTVSANEVVVEILQLEAFLEIEIIGLYNASP